MEQRLLNVLGWALNRMLDFIYILIIIVVVILGMGISIFYIKKELSHLQQKEDPNKDSFLMLQQQLQNIGGVLDNKLAESNRAIQKQANESAKVVGNVIEQLTRLDETNKQVIGFAGQLQSLENILKNPKQRGILGEYYLEELLKNVFSPGQYKMQYKFKDGEIVDAVIFLEDKIIPIDSKFSLENYNRIMKEQDSNRREQLEKVFKQDLKNRIDETSKYIRPQENTLDFAFMFIPAEAIYYDLLVNKVGAIQSNTRDLIEYASRDKNVHIVSPNTFYAYLQTILQGLRAFQIEKSAKEIRKGVEVLGKHLKGYDEYMKKLGVHLSTTCNTYNTAYKELNKIDKDVVKITEGKKSIEPLEIDKPSLDPS